MHSRTWNFTTGAVLTFGLSNLWTLADVAVPLLWFRKESRTIRFPFVPVPLVWLTILTCLIAPIVLAGALHSNPVNTLRLIARITSALLIIHTLTKYQSYRKFEFWVGVGSVLFLQLIAVLVQRFILHTVFPHGFTNNSSTLGLGATALILSPLAPFAGLILGLSLSRSYVVTVLLIGITLRRIELIAFALIGGGFLALQSFGRITLPGIETSIIDRNIINTPTVLWQWYGIGYGNYNQAFDLQAPHNIWILSWWELGVFAVPFWTVLTFSIWRFRLLHFIPLTFAGFTTPELFFDPEGIYAIALYHLSFLSLPTGKVRNRRSR